MRESLIESKCVRWAKKNGWLPYKFTSPGNAGVPDRIFIKGSIVLFVEFKMKIHGRLRQLQKYQIGLMRKHGALVFIIDDVAEFQKILSGVHNG